MGLGLGLETHGWGRRRSRLARQALLQTKGRFEIPKPMDRLDAALDGACRMAVGRVCPCVGLSNYVGRAGVTFMVKLV